MSAPQLDRFRNEPNFGGGLPAPEPIRAADMTLRDAFAGKALPAVIHACATDTRRPGESVEDYFGRKSYEMADAMLKARSS